VKKLTWKALIISFIAGALLVTAFAPFNFYIISFISLSVLFYFWVNGTSKTNFYTGFSFGLGLYCAGVSWVYVSLSTYGGMPLWMGAIAVLGFASLLSLFIAVPGYLATRFFKQYFLLSIPFIWTLFEWGKSWVLTGFPWLDLGYTQTSSWLLSWAPVGGIYLVSFIVLIISVSLTFIFCKLTTVSEKKFSKKIILPLLFISSITLASFFLTTIHWSQPIGQKINVGVVQPNTPIEKKWLRSYQTQLITKLASLSKQLHSESHTDLIIWPETALPLYVQQTDPNFWASVTPQGSEILTGIMDSPNSNNPEEIYNSAILTCKGQSPSVYRKAHLVPFGEYLPLRFLFGWVLDYLELPMSDLSSWKGSQTLNCGESLKIGLSICYEDAFASEYRAGVGDATILVNISEDAWFGDSFAPHQRQQMAQMRAAELARPLVRSANSGPSLSIDVKGKVIDQTPQFEVAVSSFIVQPHEGDTLYKTLGDWFVLLSLFVLAVLKISLYIRQKSNFK